MLRTFENKVILICGGSGSWGRELTRQLIPMNPKQVIIYSRGEILQVDMERTFNNKLLKFIIGDVRDVNALDESLSSGIDYVFNLSALKHVPVCESQPREAIKTNINGTMNLIDMAIKHKVGKFVDVSTDKAADPSNLYGNTKAIGEKLTIQANCLTKDTDFVVIRGGNVLGTNGSLVPYVINQIKTENLVKITDPRMTRFFLTLPEAINLLFYATSKGIGGETYVMNMPSFYIKDLIDILIEYYGDKHTKIEEIGTRPGEKIHEVLISEHEVPRTHYVNDDYYVIYPQIDIDRDYRHSWDKINNPLTHRLTSEDNLRDKEFLKELLIKGGWLQ